MIFLTGMPGAGKSTLMRKTTQLTGWPGYDLDQLIEKQEGQSVPEIFSERGEEAFRELENQTLTQLNHPTKTIISVGGGTPCFFNNAEVMQQKGTVIFLQPSVDLLISRLYPKRHKRPLLANKTKPELTEYIKNLYNQRLPYYQKAHGTITDFPVDAHTLLSLLTHIK